MRARRSLLPRFLLTAAFSLATAAGAWAQAPSPPDVQVLGAPAQNPGDPQAGDPQAGDPPGRVGRLATAHGMSVVHSSRSGGLALPELLAGADVVSLHVPLTAETRHLIDESKLALMKPSASIVNTSRGPVIDEAALIQALQENRLFGAALDVLAPEPPALDNPLLRMDPQRVILTPHFAASSEEVHPAVHREVSQSVAAVLAGRWPAAGMNPTVVPKKPLVRG